MAESPIVVRWMLANKDIDGVLKVAKAVGCKWTEDDFYNSCHDSDRTNYVVLEQGVVVGYAITKNHKYKFELIEFGLSGASKNAARALFFSMEERLTEDRYRIEAHIDEDNLPVQLFLKSQGFRAVRIYQDKVGTKYVFVRKVVFHTEDSSDARSLATE